MSFRGKSFVYRSHLISHFLDVRKPYVNVWNTDILRDYESLTHVRHFIEIG